MEKMIRQFLEYFAFPFVSFSLVTIAGIVFIPINVIIIQSLIIAIVATGMHVGICVLAMKVTQFINEEAAY